MKHVIWEIRYQGMPSALRHCKKCGRKTEFVCSGRFRVNVQRKYLDVWLIYKCGVCDGTWNAAVYSRISPCSLPPGCLEGFHINDEALAARYAADMEFLRRNGAEAVLPAYTVDGEAFDLEETVRLEIKSPAPAPVKVAGLVREKLKLSRSAYAEMVDSGRITAQPSGDLMTCRLNRGITLLFRPGLF